MNRNVPHHVKVSRSTAARVAPSTELVRQRCTGVGETVAYAIFSLNIEQNLMVLLKNVVKKQKTKKQKPQADELVVIKLSHSTPETPPPPTV